MSNLIARPLDRAAFAPFGNVFQHDGSSRLIEMSGAFDASDGKLRPSLAIIRVEVALASPVIIDQLERHPHTAQTFLPLRGGPSLVVVCETAPDGTPAVSTAQAFIAAGNQGVCYRRNVWHRRVSALEAPSEFAVFMMKCTEDDEDNVFASLANSLTVVFED